MKSPRTFLKWQAPSNELLLHIILSLMAYASAKVLLSKQPVMTTRIYVLHKITIALKFMSCINSDLLIPAKKLQTPG